MGKIHSEFELMFDVKSMEQLARLYSQTKNELELIEKIAVKHRISFEMKKMADGMEVD